MSIRVHYLTHSTFTVAFDDLLLLLDRGSVPATDPPALMDDAIAAVLADPRPKLAFSTHRHPDHYDPDFMHAWRALGNDYYLIDEWDADPKTAGDDILPDILYPRSGLVNRYGRFWITGSTDLGGSVMFQNGDHLIYFAGDLAVWDDEAVFYDGFEREVSWLEKRFAEAHLPRPDIIFLPCSTSDGWQEKPLLDGMARIITSLNPRYVIPMHAKGYEKFYKSFTAEMKDRLRKLSIAPFTGEFSLVGDAPTVVLFQSEDGGSVTFK